VLLAEKTESLEHLPGAIAGSVHAATELGILAFELIQSLDQPRRGACRVELTQSTFGLERALTEAGQLVGEMADQLTQLAECLQLRPSVV